MRRFLTPAWIARHVIAVVLIVVFLWLGLWQLERAQAGNAISWAYSLEWPIFAVFVLAVWIREVVQELRGADPDKPQRRRPQQRAQEAPMTSPFESDIVATRRNVNYVGDSVSAPRETGTAVSEEENTSEQTVPADHPTDETPLAERNLWKAHSNVSALSPGSWEPC
ncbi:hypothetical protein [Natronoglycomyces albus]|uniref:Uncharacterized protein n=1 Tax=Natronoglycomyces albus TaxID=2811108 RepID=A0A895XP33_9ACTN|nr:hypothetical protein [Natronoglycomyces albus]QSB04266.1 hypothetical protein JQS30_10680 [Natronoglycomyces albus]